MFSANPLRLDEELPERGVGDVLGDGPQTHLDVARQLDLAGAVAPVRQRDAPDLGVVPRRDGDLETRRDVVVEPLEGRLLGEELHEVAVGLLADGLVGRGPDGARVDVAQVDELASGIARAVLAPPRHGAAAAEARSATPVRDDRDVAAVREDLRARVRRVRRAEAAWGARERGRFGSGLLGRTRLDDGRLARDPLLQEELGRLDSRVRVEPVDHHVAQKDVGDGDERHPLVVRQVGLHDDAGAGSHGRRVAGLVRLARRVVDGVVVSERPLGALARQASQVPRGLGRLQERGQRGRVGSNDELVGQPSLQPEARDAELLVLVVAEPVDQIVGGLGDSPRHVPLATVPDLLPDGHAAALVEERPRIRSHQRGAASGTRTSSRSTRRASGRLPR